VLEVRYKGMRSGEGDPNLHYMWYGIYVNFINILWAAFAHADPKSAKNSDNLNVFFWAFGICTSKSCSQNIDEIDPYITIFLFFGDFANCVEADSFFIDSCIAHLWQFAYCHQFHQRFMQEFLVQHFGIKIYKAET
jgi:hypothetical protein